MDRAPDISDAAPRLLIDRRMLVVQLGGPHEVLSWALVCGGRRRASVVVWREVRPDELSPEVDAKRILEVSLSEIGLDDAVGLLTARALTTFEEVTHRDGSLAARCIATVGLGNALAAGDPPGLAAAVGTINILCQVSCGMSEEALVEAVALVAEARTAAVLEAKVPSGRSARPATGTGTDCIVVAAPVSDDVEAYVGKHTRIGALIGGSVRTAIARGAARW